jgi:hypothetical protein
MVWEGPIPEGYEDCFTKADEIVSKPIVNKPIVARPMFDEEVVDDSVYCERGHVLGAGNFEPLALKEGRQECLTCWHRANDPKEPPNLWGFRPFKNLVVEDDPMDAADALPQVAAKGNKKHMGPKLLTHCHQGHPFDEGNTYTSPGGQRQCRTCNKERKDRYLAKKRAESVAAIGVPDVDTVGKAVAEEPLRPLEFGVGTITDAVAPLIAPDKLEELPETAPVFDDRNNTVRGHYSPISSPSRLTNKELARNAILAGEKFFDGLSCLQCGGTKRFSSTRACVSCSLRNGAKRRKEHPEKVREASARWYKENSIEMRARAKKWQVAHPGKLQEYSKKYRAANPEKRRKDGQQWRAKNPDKVREWYTKANAERKAKLLADPELASEFNARARERYRAKKLLAKATQQQVTS